VHRQTGIDRPALPPDRPAPVDGRYHRAGDPWPVYASLEPATAWAEWRSSSGGAIDPARERRRLWRIEVSDLAVLDLRRDDAAAALEIERDALRGPREIAQPVAERARRLGADGMIVPSAADPDGWNLVVFRSGFERLRTAGSRVTHPRPPGQR
jgi:RES domain-containing protein